MSSPIIAAIRQQRQLKESLVHTAAELAHRASIYGVVSASITFMAQKCHCSPRTFQRHVLRLIELRILRKTVTKRLVPVQVGGRTAYRLRNEVNVYVFILPWKKPLTPKPPIDRMARKFPYPQDKAKEGSLTGYRENLERGLRFHSPGTPGYMSTLEEIARLQAFVGDA